MKKHYTKLKVMAAALVVATLLLGSGLLTHQKAEEILVNYWRLISEQLDFIYPVRLNASEDESDMILRVYEAYENVSRISDEVGFYSMLRDAEGKLVAEEQNFILVKRIEDGEYADSRVILLGDLYVSEDQSVQHEFAGAFYEEAEVFGTCDDTYIYLEELRWKAFAEEWRSYRPDAEESMEGTVAFEEWAGDNYYNEDAWTNYQMFSSFTFFLYGDWEMQQALNEEAKQICGQIYSDFANDLTTQDAQIKESLFTCYIGDVGYLNEQYSMPFVFVFHPINLAMQELAGIYVILFLFGIFIIAFLWYAIGKVQKHQIAYENNRRQLTRGIAHELKTPLAITKGYVENWAYLEDEDRDKCAKVMIEEINYMNTMVTDLLELSRLEAKAKEIHAESVDVYALTQSVLKRLKDTINQSGLAVKIGENALVGKFLVNADLEMMRIVLVNFISNAVKYADKEIQIDFAEIGRRVKFTITNDGQTIDIDKVDKVWDEFYKDDQREHARMGSSGLGLAIAKNILILHGAKYGCKSQNGQTAFWFEMKQES